MEQLVRVGVGVFVWKDGKFLMGQRLGSHGENTWSIPGGHLELNETWEQGAKREVREETGLRVKNVRFLTATNDIFNKDNKHYVTIWVYCDWTSGMPKVAEPDKFIRMEWKDFMSLPTPLFEPCWRNLKRAMPELFKN